MPTGVSCAAASASAPKTAYALLARHAQEGPAALQQRSRRPQTNGKLERFHRSLKAEVLNGRSFDSLVHAQQAFERWREVYNLERPHEALDMCTPVQRYECSPRPYTDKLAPIEYSPNDVVLTVDWNGLVKYRGRKFKVSNALHRCLPIALRADPADDGCFDVFFCHQRFMRLDMSKKMTSN